MTDIPSTGGRGTRIVAHLKRRRAFFRCRVCGEDFPRAKSYCPTCRTRKYSRGRTPPPGGTCYFG